jgi:Ca2+-binding RTX toxin-like protein
VRSTIDPRRTQGLPIIPLIGLIVLILGIPEAARADSSAVQDLPECEANVLARNDDGSTDAVALPFTINLFGDVHSSLYVNNNGNVTFNGPLSEFTPFGLIENIGTPIIAPFFADVDTRNPGSAEVTYGAAADGSSFCVNWAGVGVGYFANRIDRLNRFQLRLVDRSGETGGQVGDFDIIMNYGSIEWETGDASGGTNGLGGASARVGFSAGTGVDGSFFEFPGSGVNGAFLDDNTDSGLVYGSRGSTQLGRYIFAVRAGTPDMTCPGFEDDPRPQIVGTLDNDTLTGTAAAEVICGLDGNDTIRGGGGDDHITGGNGNDDIRAQYGADTVMAGPGVDYVEGNYGPDILSGGRDNDQLRGGNGDDTLRGDHGFDILAGEQGADAIDGGSQRDKCLTDGSDPASVRCP